MAESALPLQDFPAALVYKCSPWHLHRRCHDPAFRRFVLPVRKHVGGRPCAFLYATDGSDAAGRHSAERLAKALFDARQASRPARRGAPQQDVPVGGDDDVVVAMKRGRLYYPSVSRPLESGDECRSSGGARPFSGNDEEVGLLAEPASEDAGIEEVEVLQGVDLELKRGRFLVICGEIGAGKSTLLACLSLALPLTDGDVQVKGSRAYASQKAFVMSGSIRENILFQLPFEPSKYRDALERSQLLTDLDLLPMYDMTMVGPEGVQLSGGQRARVALARVIYADADVVLLDDVMSALDAETGRAVWADAICWMKARGKTVGFLRC